MDDRNGQIYPSREAALAAGVPADNAVELEEKPPGIFTQTSGPLKGRIYERIDSGHVRRRLDLESSAKLRLEEVQKQIEAKRPRRPAPLREVSEADLLRMQIGDEVARNPRASDVK